jgi:hypothetical protein
MGGIIILKCILAMSYSAFQNFLNGPDKLFNGSRGQNMQKPPGSSIGGPRQMDFRDRNGNGIDDRDEPGGSYYNPNNPKKPIGSKPKPKAETKPKSKPSTKPSKEEVAKRAAREKKLRNKMKDF